MPGQCRGLMNHVQRRFRKINRKKNFLHIRHPAWGGEFKKCALSFKTFQPRLGYIKQIHFPPAFGPALAVARSKLRSFNPRR
jgi:hypothetical protein